MTDKIEEQPALGFGWKELLLSLLVFVVGSAVVIVLANIAALVLNLQPGEGLLTPLAYVTAIGFYIALFLGIYLFGVRRAGWAALGVRGTHWSYMAIVPFLFIIGITAIGMINLLLMQVVGEFENPQVASISGGEQMSLAELIAGLLLIAGLVPVVEELFFRGMLYPLVRRHLPVLLAIVINAAIFAGVHLILFLIPSLFVVGLILAFLRAQSGSIWPGVFYHMLQNTLGMVLIYMRI